MNDSIDFVFSDHAYFGKSIKYRLIVDGVTKRDEALNTIYFRRPSWTTPATTRRMQ